MEQKILTQIESRNTIFLFFIKLELISIIKLRQESLHMLPVRHALKLHPVVTLEDNLSMQSRLGALQPAIRQSPISRRAAVDLPTLRLTAAPAGVCLANPPGVPHYHVSVLTLQGTTVLNLTKAHFLLSQRPERNGRRTV